MTENSGRPDSLPQFETATLFEAIDRGSNELLDGLDFGVIGFDQAGNIRRYNATESQLAGLAESTVVGRSLFDVVAPCMNNFMVAQQFEDAAASGRNLDTVLDYVLTFRMRPQRVKLRLLAQRDATMRYILVKRNL